MHILQNPIFYTYWYLFPVLIGLGICIIHYIGNKKKELKTSIFLLILMSVFSFQVHRYNQVHLTNGLSLSSIPVLHDEDFENSPNFIGRALEEFYNYLKKYFTD